MNSGGDLARPKSFEEVKQLKPATQCKRCNQKRATHTISMTAAKLGTGKGSVVSQVRQVPVCEPCGADVFMAFKKALKS